MPLFNTEPVEKLWDAWNIRGLIILSLLLQSFLIPFAPLRKKRGEKWVIMIPLWIAYLLADWVATFTIGLMLRAERSDILAFWAPFLLLHLGGPDTITSFSLEDNEFWIRHLLGLILQVGSTVYVILQSRPDNKLWLPTLLVFIAGIIKYAERNRAFYLASFDHFGNNWAYLSDKKTAPDSSIAMPPIPVQFEKARWSQFFKVRRNEEQWSIIPAATCTVGAIKNLLVGPPMTKDEQQSFCNFMKNRGSQDMLRTIEIQLSLLYELLHSKLPVVDSKIGYICRMVNFGCMLGALVSFSILLKKYYHNKLGEFDIYLTYGLLSWAVALDVISIKLLKSSDWVVITRQHSFNEEFINKCRWSNSVPQLNIFSCHFKNKDGELVDFLRIRSLFEKIRRIRRVSYKNFVEEKAWELIFTTLQKYYIGAVGTDIYGPSRILISHTPNFAWTINKFEHMDSLLIWHIATEICYQIECQGNRPSSSTPTSNDSFDHRKICKLFSDYLFYLLVMEPTMTAISPNLLKTVFKVKDPDGKWKWPSYLKKGYKETFIKDLEKPLVEEDENAYIEGLKTLLGEEGKKAYIDLGLLKEDENNLTHSKKTDGKARMARFPRILVACYLARELLIKHQRRCPWKLMSRFWVELLCRTAINCQPIVHARQVSRGGQLLTLVWLLTNYWGLTHESEITSYSSNRV